MFVFIAAALLSMSTAACAETPEVRIARQFSMDYLQFNVMEHGKLVQKHAATHGIPEVKVSAFRFNGPTAMNDALPSDTMDIVGASHNGILTIWSRTGNTPQDIRAASRYGIEDSVSKSSEDLVTAAGSGSPPHWTIVQ